MKILVLFLCPFIVSSMSDEQSKKLDAIEELLSRIQKEINRMREESTRNDQIPFSSKVDDDDDDDDGFTLGENQKKTTTEISNLTEEITSTQSNTNDMTTSANTGTANTGNAFESLSPQPTTALSNSEVSSPSSANFSPVTGQITTGQQLTTTGSQTTQQRSSLDSLTITKISELTTGVEKPNEAKDMEKRTEVEETELHEVEKMLYLIDEGEDLERQLKVVFFQLRSIGFCIPLEEKCGIPTSGQRCCKGLTCSSSRNGTCRLDCTPYGNSCGTNFFCCSGSTCVKTIDGGGRKAYSCQ